MMAAATAHEPGYIFQIKEKHGRKGWIGALVVADQIKPWGIRGYIHAVKTHEEPVFLYIRLPWADIEHVGIANLLIPSDGKISDDKN